MEHFLTTNRIGRDAYSKVNNLRKNKISKIILSKFDENYDELRTELYKNILEERDLPIDSEDLRKLKENNLFDIVQSLTVNLSCGGELDDKTALYLLHYFITPGYSPKNMEDVYNSFFGVKPNITMLVSKLISSSSIKIQTTILNLLNLLVDRLENIHVLLQDFIPDFQVLMNKSTNLSLIANILWLMASILNNRDTATDQEIVFLGDFFEKIKSALDQPLYLVYPIVLLINATVKNKELFLKMDQELKFNSFTICGQIYISTRNRNEKVAREALSCIEEVYSKNEQFYSTVKDELIDSVLEDLNRWEKEDILNNLHILNCFVCDCEDDDAAEFCGNDQLIRFILSCYKTKVEAVTFREIVANIIKNVLVGENYWFEAFLEAGVINVLLNQLVIEPSPTVKKILVEAFGNAISREEYRNINPLIDLDLEGKLIGILEDTANLDLKTSVYRLIVLICDKLSVRECWTYLSKARDLAKRDLLNDDESAEVVQAAKEVLVMFSQQDISIG